MTLKQLLKFELSYVKFERKKKFGISPLSPKLWRSYLRIVSYAQSKKVDTACSLFTETSLITVLGLKIVFIAMCLFLITVSIC